MPRGSKPGERRGGRAKGTKNKATLDLEAKLAAMNCDPIELLAKVANGEELLARLPGMPEDAPPMIQRPDLDQRIAAIRDLIQYVAPKRKAIEHSGSIGTHEERLEELDDLDDAE